MKTSLAALCAAMMVFYLAGCISPASAAEKPAAQKEAAKKTGSTWRTRPPEMRADVKLACDEVMYQNGPAKVLAGLEGRCADEMYYLAPRKPCPTHRAQFTPPRSGIELPRDLRPGELFKHLECLKLKPEVAGKKPVKGPIVSERR